MNQVFLYVGAGLLVFWGAAHEFGARGAIRGFGELSTENRRVLAMEWIVEGATLIFLGLLTTAVTLVGPVDAVLSRVVYVAVVLMLNALSAISLFTGFRVRFLPYRLCPAVFTGASVLILLGAVV